MATYCAKFIPSFSDISYPLCELTKKNALFQWTPQHQASFEKIKHMLTSDATVAYFDPYKETELTTDASPVSLSAILCQRTPGQNDRRVIAYVSRALSDVERQYSQTEKEALAIVWAIERLHIYVYGKHFSLFTDCKPVQLIYGNAKSKPPARIERWNLRLQGYNFSIVHTKGTENPSDFLSRHTSLMEPKREEKMAEDYVNFISLHAIPRAMTLAELQEATRADVTLQYLMGVIRSGRWDDPVADGVDKAQFTQFVHVRNELSVNSDSNLVLRGCRIVIPTSLQQRAVELAHEGHQGLVKTKRLVREKVWFPGIEWRVQTLIDNCMAVQANSPKERPQPLAMTPLSPKPWHTLNIDFCGPFPTGEYLLVVIDAYSRFPEVAIVNSTAGGGTIKELSRIFSTHGLPAVVKSDNGPPFFGEEFKVYMRDNGIQHQKKFESFMKPITKANVEAESFMKPITKAIRSAHAEGRDWRKELYRFLLNYRATPHSSTGISSAKLLFGREIATKLPEPVEVESSFTSEVQIKDAEAKRKMKEHADKVKRAQRSTIEIGDKVLVHQRKHNKFSTRFNPSPYTVIDIKGTMVTAARNEKYVTRNISLFKRVDSSMKAPEADDSDESNLDEEETTLEEHDPDLAPAPAIPPVPIPGIPPRRYPVRERKRVHRYGNNVHEQ